MRREGPIFLLAANSWQTVKGGDMNSGDLGRDYQAGEVIVRQGDAGDRMFVIQEGQAEVILDRGGKDVRLNLLGEGDLFGEMAIFDGLPRSATVRAVGHARVLSVDKKHFLRRIHEDPSLAYRLMQGMSRRIRFLNERLARQEAPGVAGTA